jgi:hypothetical protein
MTSDKKDDLENQVDNDEADDMDEGMFEIVDFVESAVK